MSARRPVTAFQVAVAAGCPPASSAPRSAKAHMPVLPAFITDPLWDQFQALLRLRPSSSSQRTASTVAGERGRSATVTARNGQYYTKLT